MRGEDHGRGCTLFIIIVTGIVCTCFFHTCAKFYKKKIPHPTFLLCAKNVDLVTGVGQLGGFLLCSSVGWNFVGQLAGCFFILFS
jgi:hypothetical protein